MQYRDGMNFTWVNGRKLGSVTQNGTTTTFNYDGEGNRIRKVSGNTTVEYIVIGGTICGEIRTENGTTTTLHYLFDENGARIGFVVNGTNTYYYRFNLQGDVTGIYDAAGNLVAEYAYDAWGKLIDSENTEIGNLNPIRYRGYYYDIETGLYYVSSRYYDPEIGRWINADGVIAAVDDSVQGYNQFAYCFNNPINMDDETGHWPKWIKRAAKAVVNTAKKVVNNVKKVVKGIADDFKNFDVNNQSEKTVLDSNYFSAYKGVPVVRTDGTRSGSFGVIFLTHETNNRDNAEGIVRHEYGHTKQLEELGPINYLITVGIPSALDLGDEWGGGIYEQKPWEVMADIYGETELLPHSQNDVNAAYKYQRISKQLGPFVLIFIE